MWHGSQVSCEGFAGNVFSESELELGGVTYELRALHDVQHGYHGGFDIWHFNPNVTFAWHWCLHADAGGFERH